MTNGDDAALIERTLAGDVRAFERLVLKHQDGVAAFIWRIVPVDMDREEVVQDVFLKAHRNLGRFKGDSAFSTWLYSIAWRTAVSKVRRKRFDTEVYEDTVPDESSGGLEQDQVSRILNDAINRLPPDERAIVTLYHAQGCTIDEISGIIEKPAGTIKSILFRVRKRLKDQLMPIVAELENTEDLLR